MNENKKTENKNSVLSFLPTYQDKANLVRNDSAMFGLGIGATILIFLLVIVGISVSISLVWGVFTFIGMCLLVASAFILLNNPSELSKIQNPKTWLLSPFGLLLLLGILMVVVGLGTNDFTIIDYSALGFEESWSMQLFNK